jgi:hypothetical protein
MPEEHEPTVEILAGLIHRKAFVRMSVEQRQLTAEIPLWLSLLASLVARASAAKCLLKPKVEV